MDDLASRLATLVEARLGGNWAELARRAELVPSSLQQIKAGSDPRASTVVKLAKALGVTTDWLLTGAESGGLPPTSDSAPPPSVSQALRVEEAELVSQLSLGRLATLGRRSPNTEAFEVYELLLAGPKTTRELLQARGGTLEDLAADLACLQEYGMAQGANEEWEATTTIAEIVCESAPDRSFHVMTAMRLIARLGKRPPGSGGGRLLTARIGTIRGGAQLMSNHLVEVLRDLIDEHADDPSEEVAEFVLAVNVDNYL